MSVLAIGHRGAAGRAPENTIAAFSKALELGVDGVELDVQLSADGVVVVFHDDTLGRTAAGNGAIGEHNWAELSGLDAGSWYGSAFKGQSIPTLKQVLELLAGRVLVNIELKIAPSVVAAAAIDSLVAATWEVASNAAPLETLVFSSFNPDAVRALRRLAPEAPIGVLYSYGHDDEALAMADELGAVNLHPPSLVLNEGLAKRAHERGLKVWTWTANEPDDIERLIGVGADAIISDFPDTVKALLRRQPAR